jgi:hypothetical protein
LGSTAQNSDSRALRASQPLADSFRNTCFANAILLTGRADVGFTMKRRLGTKRLGISAHDPRAAVRAEDLSSTRLGGEQLEGVPTDAGAFPITTGFRAWRVRGDAQPPLIENVF